HCHTGYPGGVYAVCDEASSAAAGLTRPNSMLGLPYGSEVEECHGMGKLRGVLVSGALALMLVLAGCDALGGNIGGEAPTPTAQADAAAVEQPDVLDVTPLGGEPTQPAGEAPPETEPVELGEPT